MDSSNQLNKNKVTWFQVFLPLFLSAIASFVVVMFGREFVKKDMGDTILLGTMMVVIVELFYVSIKYMGALANIGNISLGSILSPLYFVLKLIGLFNPKIEEFVNKSQNEMRSKLTIRVDSVLLILFFIVSIAPPTAYLADDFAKKRANQIANMPIKEELSLEVPEWRKNIDNLKEENTEYKESLKNIRIELKSGSDQETIDKLNRSIKTYEWRIRENNEQIEDNRNSILQEISRVKEKNKDYSERLREYQKQEKKNELTNKISIFKMFVSYILFIAIQGGNAFCAYIGSYNLRLFLDQKNNQVVATETNLNKESEDILQDSVDKKSTEIPEIEKPEIPVELETNEDNRKKETTQREKIIDSSPPKPLYRKKAPDERDSISVKPPEKFPEDKVIKTKEEATIIADQLRNQNRKAIPTE